MFLAGEFSKLAQVSKRLLHFYDEIGLFKPHHIDPETSYRYYSAAQLPELNKILALKELGLSLEQVGRVLNDDISADEIQGMLILKKAEMAQQIKDNLLRFRYIESRLQQVRAEGVLQDYDVVVKSMPSMPILTTRTLLPDTSSYREIMIEMMHTLPQRVGHNQIKHMIVLSHSEGYEAEEIDAEIGYIVSNACANNMTLPSGIRLKKRLLPEEKMMATVTRVGRTYLGSGCYHALGQWIEANDYHIIGPGREVFLQLWPNGDEEMVTEIQLPVDKTEPGSLFLTG